jgi:hypothetical protein
MGGMFSRWYQGVPHAITSPHYRVRHDTPPLLKWASFAKIRLKLAYFIFSGAPKPEYILKKRKFWHGFLEIRDYCAIYAKIHQQIGLK